MDVRETVEKILKREAEVEGIKNCDITPNLEALNGDGFLKVNALEKDFASYIKRKIYPSGAQIKSFMQKNNMKRTVAVVKSKLQHLLKLSNKK
ncbi:hypothetical protein HUJ05_001730 [Dendroctonus ponderosae]|nr:hypothetical protein HUJ05_001730 [Dendroctonus ponderosae]